MTLVKNYKYFIIGGIAVVLTIAFYIWLVNSPYFIGFKEWSQQNFAIYFSVLVFLKVVGLVWPPLPGGILTICSIPIIGALGAYLADLTGSIIGSVISYYLAFRYGYPFLEKIFDKSVIARIRNIKIRKNREFEAMLTMRIFGMTVVELVSYGAGLLRVRFRNFIAGVVLSHFLVGIPVFYFMNNIFLGRDLIISLILVVVMLAFFYLTRKRYFE